MGLVAQVGAGVPVALASDSVHYDPLLDRDILTCPTDQIRDARVLTTALDGRIVYEA